MKHIVFSFILIALLFCSCGNNTTKSEITAEMAYEGISNYCHNTYDWSVAEENPSIMYVEMGEETDSAYQVIFRSYTGSFVNFYVDKASGTTRMEEYVPTLDVRNEAGTIDLFDYIKKENKNNTHMKSFKSTTFSSVYPIVSSATLFMHTLELVV